MSITTQRSAKDVNLEYLVATIKDQPSDASFTYRLIKRLADMSVALCGLIILSPLMLGIGLLIKVFSPGPLLFRQKRIGYKGKVIHVVKFRTMHTREAYPELHEEVLNDQPFLKMKNDPRVFPFGKMLRKVSLDELPQLFNILSGDMSMVGPRPLVEEEVSLCDREQIKRLSAKPGLTGWAQINGRTDVSFDELMALDLYYLKNRSLLFDTYILLKTVKVVVTREGAY